MTGNNNNKNKGFTLVELIVVLVILAILAAILVPALLGYIDEARSKEDMLAAKNIMNAAQAELSAAYAKRSSGNSSSKNIFGTNDGNEYEIDARDYGFSRNIFERAGYRVKITQDSAWNSKGKWNTLSDAGSEKDKTNVNYAVIGVGSYSTYASNSTSATYDPHKAYTVYFVLYQKTIGSDVIIFNGTDYSKDWPFSADITKLNKNNCKLNINGDTIDIQLLYIKVGESNSNSVWSFSKAKDELKTFIADGVKNKK